MCSELQSWESFGSFYKTFLSTGKNSEMYIEMFIAAIILQVLKLGSTSSFACAVGFVGLATPTARIGCAT